MKKKIKVPYGKQFIDQKDIEIVKRSLSEEFITTGKNVQSFENSIKAKFNSKYALSCASGTAGLHLAFLAINLKKGDVVVMPSINFISAYRMANIIGAKIYLTDVDPITGQMTSETVIKCIKKNKLKKIKAVVTMYLGGYVENNLEFYKLKKKLKCYLIEDACHALGAKYTLNNKRYYIGSCKHSDLCVFSFHPVKTITTGEGGAITTNNKNFAEKIKLLRNHGIIRKSKYWQYNIKELGYNYRLSDINCALGLSQITKLDIFSKRRQQIFELYKKKLSALNNYLRFPSKLNQYNCYHLFLLSVNFKKLKCSKDKLFEYLNNKGIYPQYHYVPIFKFNFYKNKNIRMFNGAIEYYNNTLSLPIYYDLKKETQIYIIKNIIKFISINKN